MANKPSDPRWNAGVQVSDNASAYATTANDTSVVATLTGRTGLHIRVLRVLASGSLAFTLEIKSGVTSILKLRGSAGESLVIPDLSLLAAAAGDNVTATVSGAAGAYDVYIEGIFQVA